MVAARERTEERSKPAERIVDLVVRKHPTQVVVFLVSITALLAVVLSGQFDNLIKADNIAGPVFDVFATVAVATSGVGLFVNGGRIHLRQVGFVEGIAGSGERDHLAAAVRHDSAGKPSRRDRRRVLFFIPLPIIYIGAAASVIIVFAIYLAAPPAIGLLTQPGSRTSKTEVRPPPGPQGTTQGHTSTSASPTSVPTSGNQIVEPPRTAPQSTPTLPRTSAPQAPPPKPPPAPDLAGPWTVDFSYLTGPREVKDTWTIVLRERPQTECATSSPCYTGEWHWSDGHCSHGVPGFNGTVTLQGTQLTFSATDSDPNQSYNGSGPNSEPLRFAGIWTDAGSSAYFTFARSSSQPPACTA